MQLPTSPTLHPYVTIQFSDDVMLFFMGNPLHMYPNIWVEIPHLECVC